MNDEELLIKYRKYKKKRMIIICGIILIFILLASSYLYFHFNNTSSLDIEEPKKEITVKDEVAPVIKLKINNLEILKGDDINYLDYVESVVDDKDGDLFEELKYEEIDSSIIGEQSIIYSVSDSAGNSSQEILTILIKEKEIEEENIQPTTSEPTENKKNPTANNPNHSTGSNNTPKVEETPKKPSQEETPKTGNETSGKIVKYFLFSDGYTMMNVADVCAAELRKTNKTGMCSPIQDENGIYLGMKLETN